MNPKTSILAALKDGAVIVKNGWKIEIRRASPSPYATNRIYIDKEDQEPMDFEPTANGLFWALEIVESPF